MKRIYTSIPILKSLQLVAVVLPMFAYAPSFAQDHGDHDIDEGEEHEHHSHMGFICTAKFVAVADTVVNSVTFHTIKTSSSATYAWSFGDGDTSSSANPDHQFDASGTYYVCLTVTDTVHHCTATKCDSVKVQVVCNPRFRLVADTTVLGFRFVPSRNYTITTYSWDFGDGNTSSSAIPTHQFADTGMYHVCLTAQDSTDQGILCDSTFCKDIHITAICNADFHIFGNDEGDDDGDDDEGENNGDTLLTIHFFQGFSSSGATYSWDFGDGWNSDLHNPIHTYSDTGMYIVCLTVTDSANGIIFCTATNCDTIHVKSLHHGDEEGDDDDDDDGDRIAAASSSRVHVTIYPNPVRDEAVVHIENAVGNVTFTVYESTGRIAMVKTLTNGDFNLSHSVLAKGIYYYRVVGNGQVSTRGKLIIQ